MAKRSPVRSPVGSALAAYRYLAAAFYLACAVALLVVAPASGESGRLVDDDNGRPPTLRDSQFDVVKGAPTRLDVLAGAQDLSPQAQIEIVDPPSCGSVAPDSDRRAVIFDPADCPVPGAASFTFAVRQGSSIQAQVRVTISPLKSAPLHVDNGPPPAPASCPEIDPEVRLVFVRGGHFARRAAPDLINDVAAQLDDEEFDLGDFCISEEPITEAVVTQYASAVDGAQRINDNSPTPIIIGATKGGFAFGLDFELATAVVGAWSTAAKIDIAIPTLNEMTAAAWRSVEPSAPESQGGWCLHPRYRVPSFLLALRSAARYLTSSPANPGDRDMRWIIGGPYGGPGSFGPSFVKTGWRASDPYTPLSTFVVVRRRP